jgi:pSer/pThr/pTyr-binding forkhead associated (FHA) protein
MSIVYPGKPSMQAYLRVVSGPDASRMFELTEGAKLVIGRGDKSDTRLADATVSRVHCELQWDGPRFVLVDLDSVGGPWSTARRSRCII